MKICTKRMQSSRWLWTMMLLPLACSHQEKQRVTSSIPSAGLAYVGSALWTRMQDLKIREKLAYCAYKNGLAILDISDRDSPRLVSQLYLGGGSSLTLSGKLAWIAASDRGLIAVDVSDPRHPFQKAAIDTPGEAIQVSVIGHYAYVADGSSGVQIMDIRNPSKPVHAGSFDTRDRALGITVEGGLAYVADAEAGLSILSVQDPARPVEVGYCDTPGTANRVSLRGHHAYLADGFSGLQIIDVNQPSSPVIVGAYTPSGSTNGVTLNQDGKLAFLANSYDGGLFIVNVNDPKSPTLTGSLQYPIYNEAQAVSLNQDRIYLVDHFSGIWIVDINRLDSLKVAGNYYTPASILCAEKQDDLMVAVGDLSGVPVLDVSVPASMQTISNYERMRRAHDVAIKGDHVYLSDRSLELMVLRISDSRQIDLVTKLEVPGSVRELEVVGNHLVLTADHSGLHIMDINQPSKPKLLGSYHVEGYSYGLAVKDRYAYLAKSDAGKLMVVDIGDPYQPLLVGSIKTSGLAYGVAVQDHLAFVADGEAGLQIFSVEDPGSPFLIGSLNTPGFAYDVAISGEYAYVADEQAGLMKIHIRSPSSPKLVSVFDTPCEAVKVMTDGKHIFVSDTCSLLALK